MEPQYADHTFEQLTHMLLNDLDNVSTQAQLMLKLSVETSMTPTRLPVDGQNAATALHAQMLALLKLTQQEHTEVWSTGGWASHFAGCLEQLVTELMNSPSSQLEVRMGTVQIQATTSNTVSCIAVAY
jgi:hypothetical protein